MTRIKSPLAWPSGKAYLFEKETADGQLGANYLRHDFVSGALDQRMQPINPNWPGLRPTRPDAAVYWGFGKIYFFYGDEYLRYDIANDSVDAEYLPPNFAPAAPGSHSYASWPDPGLNQGGIVRSRCCMQFC